MEYARLAILALRLRGFDVFGIVMDPDDAGSDSAIFGRHNMVAVRRKKKLPAKLAGVCFRLAQQEGSFHCLCHEPPLGRAALPFQHTLSRRYQIVYAV